MQVINKLIKCDLEEISLSKRSVLTEICPLAALVDLCWLSSKIVFQWCVYVGKFPCFFSQRKYRLYQILSHCVLSKKGTFFLYLVYVDCND